MRRLFLKPLGAGQKEGQNIPKNRCRTTIAERMMETLAELPFIGDQVVCLSHEPGRPQRNAIPSEPPHTRANRDHRRSALTTAAASSGGVSAGMLSRAVPANSTSIAGAGSNAARSLPPAAIAAITTWENPLLAWPSSCRQR